MKEKLLDMTPIIQFKKIPPDAGHLFEIFLFP